MKYSSATEEMEISRDSRNEPRKRNSVYWSTVPCVYRRRDSAAIILWTRWSPNDTIGRPDPSGMSSRATTLAASLDQGFFHSRFNFFSSFNMSAYTYLESMNMIAKKFGSGFSLAPS